MSTIITAVVILAFIASFIGLFRYAHKRDEKREAARKLKASEHMKLP